MCLSLNNCCCCFSLSVGTKIISIICTVSAAVTALVYGSAAALERTLPPSRVAFYSAVTAVAMMQFVCGCLLIYGAFARSPRFIWPWAVLSWCKAALLAVLAAGGVVLLNYNHRIETNAEISAIISVYFVYALILFYFVSVVDSRRQEMHQETHSEHTKRLMRHRVYPNYYV